MDILHNLKLMPKTDRSQQGITLLEILLVLAIAAIIVTGAVSYYSQTMRYTHVTETVNFLQQVNKAGHEWLQIPNESGVYPTDFTGLGGGNGLQILVNKQLLSCPNNSCYTNTWGGSNTIDSTYPQYMTLILTKIPNGDCLLLQKEMQNVVAGDSGAGHGPLIPQNTCQPANGGLSSYQVLL